MRLHLFGQRATVFATTLLLGGCFAVPGGERLADSKQVDFRPLVGERNSGRPLSVGRVGREDVVKALGPPELTSRSGPAIGYELDTVSGYWVVPFLLSLNDANAHGYVIRFRFDPDGRLCGYDVADVAMPINTPYAVGYTSPRAVTGLAVEDLNRTGESVREQVEWDGIAVRARYQDETRGTLRPVLHADGRPG